MKYADEITPEWVMVNVDHGAVHLVGVGRQAGFTLCGRDYADWPWEWTGPFDAATCRTCIRTVRGQGRQAARKRAFRPIPTRSEG